jgi:hypothetical protein
VAALAKTAVTGGSAPVVEGGRIQCGIEDFRYMDDIPGENNFVTCIEFLTSIIKRKDIEKIFMVEKLNMNSMEFFKKFHNF